MALFAQIRASPDGSEYLVVVIRYLLSIGDKRTRAAARQVLHSVMDAQQAEALMWEWGEEMMERGRQQGREQGREQGLAQGREQGLVQGREQGLLRGRAEAVLRILSARGVQVGEEARQHILSCTDMATLDRWFDQSLNATRISDVLEDLSS